MSSFQGVGIRVSAFLLFVCLLFVCCLFFQTELDEHYITDWPGAMDSSWTS